MATQKETVESILDKLRDVKRFSARAMFGEYALYADCKVVAPVCDDRVYVKILPASAELENLCEKGEPYSGAKPHYIVEEGHLSTLHDLPNILFAIAASRPGRKKKGRRTGRVSGIPGGAGKRNIGVPARKTGGMDHS